MPLIVLIAQPDQEMIKYSKSLGMNKTVTCGEISTKLLEWVAERLLKSRSTQICIITPSRDFALAKQLAHECGHEFAVVLKIDPSLN